MEQNPMSDDVILKRIESVLNEDGRKFPNEPDDRLEAEKFHDVSDTVDLGASGAPDNTERKKRLEFENHILASQLEAERKKSRDLQSKFDLLEHSFKSFEKINGELESIKQTVEEDNMKLDFSSKSLTDGLLKHRPKTVHTAPSGSLATSKEQAEISAGTSAGEPRGDDVKDNRASLNRSKLQVPENKEEVVFRDAEDFRQLDEGLQIIRDSEKDGDTEKVYITKTEVRCFEDIGQLAARTRPPLDEKHQRFFERDRKKYANRMIMPETQEIEKTESVPPEIISKTKETPVNITSTELDGLRSYLIQLKELIARRETAWARTTERDYNQRVEITRFKNEVTHLRMLCEKRQKDVKERDQIIALKDEEINDLQKRVKALKNAVMKLERKDDRIMDTLDGLTNEVLENSQIVQRSYNAMKRTTMLKNSNASNNQGLTKTVTPNPYGVSTKPKESSVKKPKALTEKSSPRRLKLTTSNEEESRITVQKSKSKIAPDRYRQRQSSTNSNKETIEKVDEKLQKIEEMIHAEVLKENKKQTGSWRPSGKNQAGSDLKNLIRNHHIEKGTGDVEPNFQRKVTPSSSKMRQEMLVVMSGMNSNMNLGSRPGGFSSDSKKPQVTAAILQNALFAARNANLFNK